jgi:alkylation response protein AidB-like acyl-CoA dehydrogenase
MDFHLTEAEQMLQATAREFAKNEIERWRLGRQRGMRHDNFKKMAEVAYGWLSRAEYGGCGGVVMPTPS